MRERHLIDGFKGATGLIIFIMLASFGRWESSTCWVYLALHGSYGIFWVVKSRIFGDKNWDRFCTIKRGVLIFTGLLGYWVAPFLLMSSAREASPAYLAGCVALYAFGVFLHFVSDMQKWMWLQLRPGELLDQGLWARTRNPNYFGELMIYSSFAALSLHGLPWLIFSMIVIGEWIPNLLRKDRSLARYSKFVEYKKKSGLIFPKIS